MVDYKTLGKYIVSEKIKKQSFLSNIFRGIKTDNGKFEKFVLLKIFNSDLNGFDDFLTNVIGNVDKVKKLNNVSSGKVIDYSKESSDPYLVYDYENGEFLIDIINQSRKDGIPFTVSHVLSIISGILHSLEEAHSKNIFHGFIVPHSVLISYEGKVKLYDYATGPYLINLIKNNEDFYKFFENLIHPEVINSSDKVRNDILSVGLLILKMLTGKCVIENGKMPEDLETFIDNLEMGIGLDTEPVPDDIKNILKKSLLEIDKYETISQFRENVDEIIKSDKYSPTTFNLAFFIHSMFREKSEKTVELLEVEKKLNYSGYLSFSNDSENIAVKKSNKSVIAVLSIVIVIILSVGYYFHVQSVKAEKEKLVLAKEANEAAKKALQVEKEMQAQIEKMKKEREKKIKEIMNKADKEADKIIKQEMIKKKKEQERLYEERLKELETKKKNAIEEKKKKLEYAKKLEKQNNIKKAIELPKENIEKNEKVKKESKLTKTENLTKTESLTKTTKSIDYLKKDEKAEEKSKKKNDAIDEIQKNKNIDKIKLPKPLLWSDNLVKTIYNLKNINSIKKISLNGKGIKKEIDFSDCKDENDIKNIITNSLTNGTLKFKTQPSLKGNFDILTIENKNLYLVASKFKYLDIDFNLILHLKQDKRFIGKLSEGKFILVDNYKIPLFVNEIELKATRRFQPSFRKKIESFLFNDFRKNFTIVAKVKNRNTTKYMLVDSLGNKFDYYFDMGNNFTGSNVRIVFSKK